MAVTTPQWVTVTAMETKKTPSASVAEIAQPMPTTMASVTTWTTASEASTHAASVTVPVRFTNAVVTTSPLETATAMEIKKTPSAFAVAIAQPTPTTTASVTTWTIALAPLMLAASAMVPARFTNVDAPTSLQETATAMETKKTPSASVVEIARQMQDSDGICDDVDDCVGTPDACGVCNGPGDIYECGCTNIPAGDCDCNGNQEDAAGVCGGDCASDLDGDGICDTDEIPGCDDPLADNYDSSATDNDGTCVYMPASFDGLVAEAYQLNSVEQGTHTFRVYAQFSNPNDQLISVFGTAANPLSVASSTSFYQDANGGPTSGGSNPLLFPGFPNLEWDSFVTIGSDDNNISGFQTAGLDFSSFEAGEALTSNATAGGSWFVFPDQEPQAFPSAAGRVLIGQFTTDGTVTLNCNIQYRAADGTNPQAIGLTLVLPQQLSRGHQWRWLGGSG